jgi:hypothetical protein
MNKIASFQIAKQIADAQLAQAHEIKIASMFSRLAGMGAGLAEKASPYLDKGFSRLGQAASGVQNPILSKLLTGAAHNPSALVGTNGFNQLGRTVAKRVGAGAGGAYGGAVALEAPFKHQNNEAYEEQQAHPIRSWLAQHLAGAPKLQHRSYLNPFSI